MFHQLLLFITAALISPVVSHNSTGEDDCPCVSVYHNTSGIVGDTTMDYPSDYGSTVCTAHDAGMEPYCNSDDDSENPLFCSLSWCYIDADRCRDSDKAYYQSKMYPGLFYSYATCGSDASSWFDEVSAIGLEGTEVLAAIPYFSYPDSWQVLDGIDNFGPTTNDTSGYVGLYIDLMNIAADRAGFTLKWAYVSQASRNEYSSAWTACVADVGKGLIDICIGNFWTTQERLGMSAFSTSWDINDFYLMVPRDQASETFFDYVEKPFEPFTLNAWICILAVVLFTSIIKAKVVMELNQENDTRKNGPAEFFRIEVYECFLEFVSGSVNYGNNTRIAPRILNLGYGVFILITVACYTGNLTAILTTSNLQSKGFTSMQDCIDVQCTICVNTGIAPVFMEQYGNSGVTIKIAPGSGGYSDVAEAMLNTDDCDIGLDDEISYRTNMGLDKYKGICDYRFLGNSLNWTPLAQPVKYEMTTTLNRYIREIVTDGTYDRILGEYIKGFTATCNAYLDAYDEDISETASLDYKHLLGPVIISFVCSLLAIMINFQNLGRVEFASQCLKRFLPKRDSKDLVDDGSTNLDEIDVKEYLRSLHSQRDKEHAEIMARFDQLTRHMHDDELNEACS